MGVPVPRQVAPPTPAPAPPAPAPAPGVLSKVFGSVPWWTWDRKTVSDGIFKNENIMIHVGQNMFNFVFSTLAWFTVSQIYSLFNRQPTARGGRQVGLGESSHPARGRRRGAHRHQAVRGETAVKQELGEEASKANVYIEPV